MCAKPAHERFSRVENGSRLNRELCPLNSPEFTGPTAPSTLARVRSTRSNASIGIALKSEKKGQPGVASSLPYPTAAMAALAWSCERNGHFHGLNEFIVKNSAWVKTPLSYLGPAVQVLEKVSQSARDLAYTWSTLLCFRFYRYIIWRILLDFLDKLELAYAKEIALQNHPKIHNIHTKKRSSISFDWYQSLMPEWTLSSASVHFLVPQYIVPLNSQTVIWVPWWDHTWNKPWKTAEYTKSSCIRASVVSEQWFVPKTAQRMFACHLNALACNVINPHHIHCRFTSACFRLSYMWIWWSFFYLLLM